MRLIISGDSHGSAMFGVLEGFPAGFRIDLDRISWDLKRRRSGYGRGRRMRMEADEFEIASGVWKGYTTGAPITVVVKNRAGNPIKEVRSVPRPGHVDYSGWRKYGLPDLNIYVERSSARWTVAFVAVGSLLKQFLETLDVVVYSYVLSIGKITMDENPNLSIDELIKLRDNSPVFCPNERTSDEMVKHIDEAMRRGDTLGGSFKVIAHNIPPGLGGYSNIFEKLDSRIGAVFMAIPSVKGVFIGREDVSIPGREYHDPFFLKDGEIGRRSNNAGGIEGGLTNGEDVEVTVYLKPIPTLGDPLDSVDLSTMEERKAPYVRSDVTVVPSASVVGEMALSLVLAEAVIRRYGEDEYEKILSSVENDKKGRRWKNFDWD